MKLNKEHVIGTFTSLEVEIHYEELVKEHRGRPALLRVGKPFHKREDLAEPPYFSPLRLMCGLC